MLLEVRRKIAHILLGLFIIVTYNYGVLKTKHLFFAIIIFSVLSLISLKFKFPIISFLLKNFEREKFVKEFPFKGMIFFLVGCLLTLKIFSKDIALASIMILTLGDSVSFLYGTFLGKIRLRFNIQVIQQATTYK